MTETDKLRKKDASFSIRSFITATAVIFILMVCAYVLSITVPGGSYDRSPVTGTLVEGSFHAAQGGIPFWKWCLSPFLVLGASGNGTLIAVIVFLLVIGGVFNCLGAGGLMTYMLDKITYRYGKRRYTLMAVIIFFFMAMGAMIGSFEECVPMVPLVVSLACLLGWDSLTGMGMSLLSVGCGFASGVCNSFTVGVAQTLAGLPMFSGIWLRLVSFVLIYLLLVGFVMLHARRIEQPIADRALTDFCRNDQLDRGLTTFVAAIGTGIVLVLCSGFLTFLQDYTMIIIALAFLIGGLAASVLSGMKGRTLCKTFGTGVAGILPAVAMILMASSIKYTLETANVLDTVLHSAVSVATALPKWAVILFIYLIVLGMNFFIGSGSAKAFMLIPLIVPLARQFGISSQLCIVAFAFGDGFSNTFYPTNAALLISLGLAGVSYGKWFRYSWKFQGLNLIMTALILLLGLAVGY